MIASLLALAIQGDTLLRSCLVIGGVGRGGRVPFNADAVTNLIVTGKWSGAKAGDSVDLPNGTKRTWEEITAGEDGWFQNSALGGGYACFYVESDSDQVKLLTASGDSYVSVNGVLRGGDPYQYGYLTIPIRLRKGTNELLFSCGRGRLRVQLADAPATPLLNTADLTLPDITLNYKEALFGAVPVVNPTNRPQRVTIRAKIGSEEKRTSPLTQEIPALSVRKLRFEIPNVEGLPSGETDLTIEISDSDRTMDAKIVKIRVREPAQSYKRTFISGIDGSVQYYAVNPIKGGNKPGSPLVLTLHGASVEGLGQVEAYGAKDWCNIVAPTNRRPYGFDWEEVGRLDAMEVLDDATKTLRADTSRTYLTGHSMGGHGTWQIGATFPDKFAAIAPSAGWISFFSYGGGSKITAPSPVEEIVQRASNQSDTLSMIRNYLNFPIYILHGDKDDNVPVSEARAMRDNLKPIHSAVQYHEQPGAGHWWGNECVDWKPIFDLFQSSKKSEKPFDFTTINPGVSDEYQGVRIMAQQVPLLPSRISGSKGNTSFDIKTENVKWLAVEDVYNGGTGKIDGQSFQIPKSQRHILFQKSRSGWELSSSLPEHEKRITATGPFKQVFQKRFCLVFGTEGTAEENEWMRSKAVFDAETFGYRGNGSVDVLSDKDFKRAEFEGRNILVYGNATINSVWKTLAKDCPVKVEKGRIQVGTETRTGPIYSGIFVYPHFYARTESAFWREGATLVGFVGGSGLVGMRATDRIPYFTSGVQLPDWTIFDPSIARLGSKGVVGAGYFANDWTLLPSQSAWRIEVDNN